jgi:glycosyltransferase involved in cell wall biosynthesis
VRAGGLDVEYDVAYLLPWKSHLVPDFEALGVRPTCLGVRSELNPRWLWRLWRLIRRQQFDVVHAHAPMSAAFVRVLLRAMPHRPVFVYTEHNRWPSYDAVPRLANRLTFPLNDAAFAVSSDVKDSVSSGFRARVEVLVHGIDLDAVRAQADARLDVRRQLGIPNDQFLVVTVANYRTAKGYPYLLRAAAQLRDEGVPIRFAVVGQGQREADVKALHSELRLEDTMQLLGYRPDAVRVIAAADVFALASLHEGLPVAVMEAQALGIPVVGTAVGGLPEAITNDENGLLVPPSDPASLAAALRATLDPAVRARLSAGARDSGERYASRVAVERLEREYRELTVNRVGAAETLG